MNNKKCCTVTRNLKSNLNTIVSRTRNYYMAYPEHPIKAHQSISSTFNHVAGLDKCHYLTASASKTTCDLIDLHDLGKFFLKIIYKLMGKMQICEVRQVGYMILKDVTPLLRHWSYFFLALSHRCNFHLLERFPLVWWPVWTWLSRHQQQHRRQA